MAYIYYKHGCVIVSFDGVFPDCSVGNVVGSRIEATLLPPPSRRGQAAVKVCAGPDMDLEMCVLDQARKGGLGSASSVPRGTSRHPARRDKPSIPDRPGLIPKALFLYM